MMNPFRINFKWYETAGIAIALVGMWVVEKAAGGVWYIIGKGEK
jgi:hypothetical protein